MWRALAGIARVSDCPDLVAGVDSSVFPKLVKVGEDVEDPIVTLHVDLVAS